MSAEMHPKPFTIHLPDEVLDELHSRLAHTRWPDPLPYPGWASGVNLDYLRGLVEYWANSFDWRAQERRLNSFPQFTAEIDGQLIHFVHQRGRGPHPFPLVLTHGWPSSYVELLKLVPLLTDPAGNGGDERDSFDVVVPSLPGFAFSGRPERPGVCTSRNIANLWARLMTEYLGYARFGPRGRILGRPRRSGWPRTMPTRSSAFI
jgi:pimeloyl-ACP methyl ester carboxylesterase